MENCLEVFSLYLKTEALSKGCFQGQSMCWEAKTGQERLGMMEGCLE